MIFTIFKKELKDTLRDRRTLMMMLVIPILIFPIILNIFVTISSSFQEEAANKTLKIGVVGKKDNYFFEKLQSLPEIHGKKTISFYADSLTLKKAVQDDSVQLGMFSLDNFNEMMSNIDIGPTLDHTEMTVFLAQHPRHTIVVVPPAPP